MARRVAREEGILIGGSGGLAVAAAMKLGGRSSAPTTSSSSSSPTPAAATCRRSSTTTGWPTYGFLRECDLCVGAVLDARGEEVPPLVYVNPDRRVREAVDKMHPHGISQLPVCKNEPPFAAAEVSGAVDELELMDAAFRDPSILDTPGREGDGPEAADDRRGPAAVRGGRDARPAPALLVLSGGRPLSVLTRSDVLSFLSPSGADPA